MDNIYLIGMMGSGKSTIGEKLANNLNMEYVDIDNDIESIHQMTIVDIFNQLGEKKFREINLQLQIALNLLFFILKYL